MLEITRTGRVLLDGCIIGGLHHIIDSWCYQSCMLEGVTWSSPNRDTVIEWMLDIIDDGIIAL